MYRRDNDRIHQRVPHLRAEEQDAAGQDLPTLRTPTTSRVGKAPRQYRDDPEEPQRAFEERIQE